MPVQQKNSGGGGGGFLMRAAYAVHGAIAPFVPTSLQLSAGTKQTIRRWIVRVDDTLLSLNNNSSEAVGMMMLHDVSFVPGTEELMSSSSYGRPQSLHDD
jgi:hypothetical protein